jgi:hypothetical protein
VKWFEMLPAVRMSNMLQVDYVAGHAATLQGEG